MSIKRLKKLNLIESQIYLKILFTLSFSMYFVFFNLFWSFFFLISFELFNYIQIRFNRIKIRLQNCIRNPIKIWFFCCCPPSSRSWVPVVGPTERCGRLNNVLVWIPASNGLRDGFDLGLIPDVEREVDCMFKVWNVSGFRNDLSFSNLQCFRVFFPLDFLRQQGASSQSEWPVQKEVLIT